MGSGLGGRGSEGSPDGDGLDEFRFILTREEFLDVFFEDLKLPNLVRTRIMATKLESFRRAGYTIMGPASNLDVRQTMARSLGRRFALKRPNASTIEDLKNEIEHLTHYPLRTAEDDELLDGLRGTLEHLEDRRKIVPYIDPTVDKRLRRFELVPAPATQAVMFCLMDVSGSMDEHKKMLAKRFFLLQYLFLTRQYKDVIVVFIRHTTEAKEVDEKTFFENQETGGTVVSSALSLMIKIARERFGGGGWNVYCSQASDGENYSDDIPKCAPLLENEILPIVQYYAYIEVLSDGPLSPVIAASSAGRSDLWKAYEPIAQRNKHFKMKIVGHQQDIHPVFRELFAKHAA